ncbi:MAG: hypothetical protein PHI66_03180, partial [Candidatus Pacebacteria bacterium]|nr:hypothetical protein [Candidatus Paceibacterota bacterium]
TKNILISTSILFLGLLIGGMFVRYITPACEKDCNCEISNDASTSDEEKLAKYQEEIDSDMTSWQEEWVDYTSQNGVSFKYPKYITGIDSCGAGRVFFVPTKIFEYDEVIYIMPEYYYNFKGEPTEETICEKYFTSDMIDKIKQDRKPLRGWRIDIRSIKDKENDINSLIKDIYDYGCKMESETSWIKDGISTIKMNVYKDTDGNPTSLGETICPMNGVYKILYSEENKLAVSVILGQECTFWGDGQNMCFDEKIVESMDF